MPSLFAGTDRLICQALGIERRDQLYDKTLRVEGFTVERASRLVEDIYDRMMTNTPSPVEVYSKKLWHCRRATEIAGHNLSKETLLEKAVAALAHEGHMPGWFNQCPVASGITGSSGDRKRAVDLVHLSGETARLVELKWSSNTPAHALFQLLEYGLAYCLARLRKNEMGLDERRLMNVRHIRLDVVGPGCFFGPGDWPDLFTQVDEALGAFVERRSGGAWKVSLRALKFPEAFTQVPFANGNEVIAECRSKTLMETGRMVRDAFYGLADASLEFSQRFLPGVPGADIERLFDAAPGDEIGSGKFDNPESSAALAANAFGYFLHRAQDLPTLPDCWDEAWPAQSISLESTLHFPWSGGRHPVLDCLVDTPSALIGIESKRFEPYRKKSAANLSEAYWRPVWGDHMKGYECVRNALMDDPHRYQFLDAAQLVKHAFALRSQVHRRGDHYGLKPTLFYIYAEPDFWPNTGRPVDENAKSGHRKEIDHFAQSVAGDEIAFVSCTYRSLLEAWREDANLGIRTHADAVIDRFAP